MKEWDEMTILEQAEHTRDKFMVQLEKYERKASEAEGEYKLHFFSRINYCYGYILEIEDIIKLEKECASDGTCNDKNRNT